MPNELQLKVLEIGERMKPMATRYRWLEGQRAQFAKTVAQTLLAIGTVPEFTPGPGEQKYRQCTVQEAIDRAIEGAEKLYAALEAKGWLLEQPALEDFIEDETTFERIG